MREPGVKLAPAGITLAELIDEYCGGMLPGHTLYGYLPGGASGGILPASLANIPLDFDTLQPYGCFIGSAAVVVLSDHDSAVGAARNTMRFFEHESCGQCTPCRNGTAKASMLMASERWDLPLLEDLSLVMRDASICGLGQAAPNPIDCVVKYFPHELRHECPHAQRDRQLDAPVVRFELNGRDVEAPANRTLIEIADAEGIEIPRLCYKPGLDKVGNCRACMVEIAGERVLAPSCCRTPTDGMKVTTDSERALQVAAARPRAAALGHAGGRVHAPQRARRVGRPARRRQAALRSARAGRARPVASGDGGEPVGVHPVHALRARLPRRAGQRRDRPRLPRQRARRSSSTWTTRWATPRASPAANACRRARPER